MPRSDCDRTIGRALTRALAFALLAASLAACAEAPPGRTQLDWPVGTTYRVQDGDTLSQIAENYSVSEERLARYNDLSHPSRLYVGEVLRIPRDGYSVAPSVRPVPRPAYRVARYEPRYESRREAAIPDPRPEYRLPRQPYYAPSRAPEDAPPGAPRFIWPVAGHVIAGFGSTASGGRNDGINIETRMGAPIRAAADGTVIYAGDELKGYGNLILIRHDDGYVTAYAHAESLAVERNTRVRAGDIIGYAGDTGNVSVPQVHFEIRRGVHPVDPEQLLVASADG